MFPYFHMTVWTPLTVDEILRVLDQRADKNTFWPQWPPKLIPHRYEGFLGATSQRGFRLCRFYTVSPGTYFPNRKESPMVIYGKFHPAPAGTHVDIRISLHPMYYVADAILILIWLPAFLGPIIRNVPTLWSPDFCGAFLASTLVILGIVLLPFISFSAEVEKSRDFLKFLWQPETDRVNDEHVI